MRSKYLGRYYISNKLYGIVSNTKIKQFLRAYAHYYAIYDNDSPTNGYVKKYKIKKGDVVVDAGAYVGGFALYASRKVGRNGKVIAFEPDDVNYLQLLKSIDIIGAKNISVIKKGLWETSSVLKFKHDADGAESSLLFDEIVKDYLMVPVVSLDEELKVLGINNINFIKMDIEGSEVKAINGMIHTLNSSKNVNLAIASYHIVDGKKTCFALERMLRELGFETETSFPQHLTTYAWKKKSAN